METVRRHCFARPDRRAHGKPDRLESVDLMLKAVAAAESVTEQGVTDKATKP